ncbi:MAG: ribbon-helix-helix protein, CopG family [Flavobacteriales bacterium]|jgi:siderophore synthetase component|nr:ribbon-helix-helix protein, CopG family [Flavobacteriales bacterium]MBK6550401.1 ribbon-helix-helix protein, CopG family [Flavobacteriales bacterium]MBK6881434.1 ribbon-helix-helix protein, CopG family [Flavobacteriales bacterium]MBK7102751.1 ribbon-helix-helix protein, CopG family [Flavobacteriales bacterium]MBK7113643.1 ribbon-helix-helix protein, CopG family [Flavobacteriales bacterium]
MKKKLTLSIEESLVRKAKANSRKQGKSVSEFLEEAIEEATNKKKPARKRWSEVWGGSLKLDEADAARDDRMGRLVRRARTKAANPKQKRA